MASSGFLPLLLVLGLMMAPVSCTCGASVPHGHSLFQLPSHHHGAVDSQDHTQHQPDEDHGNGYAHSPHPLVATEEECDESHPEMTLFEHFAMSNALERQDGWVLQAPPSSSIGQPMAMLLSSELTAPKAGECESLTLPPTRILEGMEPSPETPPPRA